MVRLADEEVSDGRILIEDGLEDSLHKGVMGVFDGLTRTLSR